MGYNLLVRLREHEKTNEPIYVLGKTKYDTYDKKLQRYPKGTKLYLAVQNELYNTSDKRIMEAFKEKFTQMKDYGDEYFQGDCDKMIAIMNKIIKQTNTKINNVNDTDQKITIEDRFRQLDELVEILDESDILERLTRLEQLEPYEVIHEHWYPKWDTLDELKKLDSFKYLESCWNWRNHHQRNAYTVNNTIRVLVYLGELNNLKYIFGRKEYESPVCDKELYDITESGYGLGSIYYDSFLPHRDLHIRYVYFDSSTIKLVSDKLNICIKLNYYIINYVSGWILLNHHLVAFRDPIFKIYIKDNKCRISIYRTKKMQINGFISDDINYIHPGGNNYNGAVRLVYLEINDIVRYERIRHTRDNTLIGGY
jgi:hypothetical protein